MSADHAVSEPTTNIGTWLQAYYEQTFPNSSVVTFDGDFRFLEFAADPKNELRIRPLEGVKPLLSYRFRYLQRRSSSQGKMLQQATFAAWEISWQGLEAKVFYATVSFIPQPGGDRAVRQGRRANGTPVARRVQPRRAGLHRI